MRRAASGVLMVVLGLSLWSGTARGDVEGAKKYIAEATEKIQSTDLKEAGTALDLAETQLEGVPDADAAPLREQIAALRKSMASAADSEARTRLMRDVERAVRNARESIGNVRDFDDNYKSFNELVNDPENKRLIGAEEYARLVKEVEGFKKVHDKQAVAVHVENAERDVKSLETDWAEKRKEIEGGSPAAQQHESRSMYYAIEKARRALEPLAADNDARKALEARIAKVEQEFNAVVATGETAEYVERLKSFWTSYKDEFDGWQSETDTPPSFKDYMNQSGGNMDRLNIPRTAALIAYTGRFFEQFNQDANFKEMSAKPEVKAVLDEVKSNFDKARARAVKIATAVVEEAERAELTPDLVAAASRLGGQGGRGTLHQVLGDDAPELKGLVERCNALIEKQRQAVAAADAAFEKMYQDMKAAAAKAWPQMKGKFSVESGFDPNNPGAMKGKLISITTDNLMGWRFKPGDFPFATTLNGVPIACRMEPEVQKAWDEVSAKVKHTVGDIEQDGKWEIIARVEGTTGQMMAKKTAEGDVRVGGETARVTTDYAEAVTAPIVTIVAAYCGPLAVATGAGVVSETGKIEPTGGSSGSGGSTVAVGGGGSFAGWMWRILTLLVGLAAAAAALMKANFAPLTNVPQAGQVQSKLGGENLAIVGLICAGLGLLFLLRGYIYMGLLTNLAIIAAGLYAASDWLSARGIVKADLAAKVRPLGVPIGLACAALVIVSLLLSLIGLNLVVV